MDEKIILNNAPITEGVVNVQVKLRDDFDVAVLDVHNLLQDRFPVRKVRRKWEGHVEIQEGKEPSHTSEDKGAVGYMFISGDGKEVVQFREDGFSFSRLKPYTNWDDIKSKSHELWAIYKNISQPISITSTRLRYINQLDIPQPVDDLIHWLKVPPAAPDNVDLIINGFFSRVLSSKIDDKIAVITQALEPNVYKTTVPMILDIEVIDTKQYDPSDENVWNSLDQLRQLKNSIFFNSITEKTMELFL